MVAQGGAVPIEEEQFPVAGEQVPEGEQQGSAEGDHFVAQCEAGLGRGGSFSQYHDVGVILPHAIKLNVA
eukprot:8170252-Pyramimonas_sp.AAC.1